MRRVVVTGMGGLSPIGNDWTEVERNLRARKNGVRVMDSWSEFEGLNTRLGAVVNDFNPRDFYGRKVIRTMGLVSLMATRASELALEDAGLLDDPVLKNGRCGVSYGSSSGSKASIIEFADMFLNKSTDSVNATTYIRMMPHTTVVSVGMFFGMTGRVLPSATACTSGSLSIGMAYEAIAAGHQDIMVAGGSEELSPADAAVFDTLYAASRLNDQPSLSPRPFDKSRDGLVVGEGAGTLVLEELEHAKARGAGIHAEVVGFGTNSDGQHPTQPTAPTMAVAMELALEAANLVPSDIAYVNAHGTATQIGDIAESHATNSVFGDQIPISSLKSYTGHTLGACGALEAWMTIKMMQLGWYAPTVNLSEVDDRCAPLGYIIGDGLNLDAEFVMSNNFAFGGVNTSLIFRRFA